MSQEDNRQDDIDVISDSSDIAVDREAPAQEGSSGQGGPSVVEGDNREPTIVPVEQTLSNKLYLIPVSGRPIFPGIFTPLMITASDDARVAEESYAGDGLIGIVMLREETVSSGRCSAWAGWNRS